MVALYSSNPNKYISYGSSTTLNITEMKRYGLDSLVIYEKSKKRALDGIADRWKKLTLVDQGDSRCKVFNEFVNKNDQYSRRLKRDLPDQCLVVEILEGTDNVNFINPVKAIDVMYHNNHFSVSKHNTKIVNDRNGEVFIEVQQVLAGFPRFPHNFYAGFVSNSKTCKKADQLREDEIQGPSAKSIIFNEKKVKQLKEKGYGV